VKLAPVLVRMLMSVQIDILTPEVRMRIPKRAVLMRGGETARIGADACDSLRSLCFGLPGGSCSLAEKPVSMSLTDRALRLRQGSRAQDAYSQGCG